MVKRERVIGDRELIAALKRLPQSTTQTLDRDIRESLEPMRETTSRNARKLRQPFTPRGGHLDEGVVVRKVNGRGPFYRVFWVSFARRARKIAHLVEFGTAPHWQPRRFGGWMHPGARAKPFFRPAFESTKTVVVTEFGKRAWGHIRNFTLSAVKTRRR